MVPCPSLTSTLGQQLCIEHLRHAEHCGSSCAHDTPGTCPQGVCGRQRSNGPIPETGLLLSPLCPLPGPTRPSCWDTGLLTALVQKWTLGCFWAGDHPFRDRPDSEPSCRQGKSTRLLLNQPQARSHAHSHESGIIPDFNETTNEKTRNSKGNENNETRNEILILMEPSTP